MQPADITLVHFSDLHHGDQSKQEPLPSTNAFAEVILSQRRAKHLIIAFTGDLAYSGLDAQYQDVECLLSQLVSILNTDFSSIHLALVPGNHDVDMQHTHSRNHTIKGVAQEPAPSLDVLNELSGAQTHFINFAKRCRNASLNWETPHHSTTVLDLNNERIQITGVNTASCSVLREKPGNLFVCPSELPKREANVSLHVILMHHPTHWLHQSVRQDTNSWLASSSELVLTGHEHEADQIELSRRGLPSTLYLPAQALCANEAKSQGFQILNIDLKSNSCSLTIVNREGTNLRPLQTNDHRLATAAERSARIRPNSSFLNSLEELNLDIKHKSGRPVTHSSVFVPPLLRIESLRDSDKTRREPQILDGAQLAERVILERAVLIIGEEQAGKTFLVRQMYKQFLNKGMYPLLLDARNLRSTNIGQLIDDAILSQYSLTQPNEFFARPKSDRVLIIEDIDQINNLHRQLEPLVLAAQETFDSQVYTCREQMLLSDPLSNQTTQELWNMPRATICSFGHSKRSELVSRWIAHDSHLSDVEASSRQLSLERRLSELLSQKAVPSLPNILTLILETMDSRDSLDESTGAFGYHYQRLILDALLREQRSREAMGKDNVTEDVALELLGRIAYAVYERKGSIDYATAVDLARNMKSELLINFKVATAMDTLIGASLLRRSPQGSVDFKHKYIYQYSVAKLLSLWLNNRLHSDRVRDVIEGLIAEMHSSESASVLVFFTFLTRDSRTIAAIVEHARQTFHGVRESAFGDELRRFALPSSSHLPALSPDVRRNRQLLNERLDSAERNDLQSTELIENLREDSRESVREIDRAFQCMLVLGQILRAYPTRLSKEEKIEVATECYRLGLRTFSTFLEAIESARELVKEYFRRITSGYLDAHDVRQLEVEVERHVSTFVEFGLLGLLKRIARSVGSSHLRPLYREVVIEGCELPVSLINRTIGLDLLHELKVNETVDLYRKCKAEHHDFAAAVLRRLVWEYLLLHAVSGDDRQSLQAQIEIGEHPAVLGQKLKVTQGLVSRKRKVSKRQRR